MFKDVDEMMGGMEVPDNLPATKHIDISNEEYQKIQSLFCIHPERLNPEDAIKSVFDSLNSMET